MADSKTLPEERRTWIEECLAQMQDPEVQVVGVKEKLTQDDIVEQLKKTDTVMQVNLSQKVHDNYLEANTKEGKSDWLLGVGSWTDNSSSDKRQK